MNDDRNSPATKQDLVDLERRLDQHLMRVQEDLVEKMRDMQTEVLRAFHNWARPNDVKIRSHEERIALLESRVDELERGKFPGHSS